MKNLRQLCAITLLTFVLAISAFAGDMGAPVAPPTPSSSPTSISTGEMGDPVAPWDVDSSNEITYTDEMVFTLQIIAESILALL